MQHAQYRGQSLYFHFHRLNFYLDVFIAENKSTFRLKNYEHSNINIKPSVTRYPVYDNKRKTTLFTIQTIVLIHVIIDSHVLYGE